MRFETLPKNVEERIKAKHMIDEGRHLFIAGGFEDCVKSFIYSSSNGVMKANLNRLQNANIQLILSLFFTFFIVAI